MTADLHLSVLFDSEHDDSSVRIVPERLEQVIRRLLATEEVAGAIELSLLLTSDRTLRRLNRDYRHVDAVTDVLSFPQDFAESVDEFDRGGDRPRLLGDIVVSVPCVVRQAQEYGHSFDRELLYLVAHGTLHLLGYDHQDEAQRRVMRLKEESALAEVPR